ncbi:methionine ABC transporter permease [Jonesiaceae bacterium BS-20]|uniref:Methionine ABC transporter permease n=1 Tax=Jonesiaceae bacterium BS-20 TaxID=3120821 RepID=A0AAU7E0T1_9MICO
MGPAMVSAFGQTMYMVAITMIIGGFAGLVVGLGLYLSRPGNLFQSKILFNLLNILVNIVRPIPFIIFIAAVAPLTRIVVGTTLGATAGAFAMCFMATFAFARLVEQNLVSLDPGVIEAARAMGASRLRVIRTVIIPEALGPLILAYTFLFIGVVDMSAMVGAIGGGGLGDMAIRHGYNRLNWEITYVVVIIIIILVQLAQFLGNWLAKKALRR